MTMKDIKDYIGKKYAVLCHSQEDLDFMNKITGRNIFDKFCNRPLYYCLYVGAHIAKGYLPSKIGTIYSSTSCGTLGLKIIDISELKPDKMEQNVIGISMTPKQKAKELFQHYKERLQGKTAFVNGNINEIAIIDARHRANYNKSRLENFEIKHLGVIMFWDDVCFELYNADEYQF